MSELATGTVKINPEISPVKEGDPVSTTVTTTQEVPGGSAVTEVISEIPTVVKESKEGYKTTEFWVAVVISLLTVLNGIPMPEKYEGFVVAALGAAYALSRGVAKKGVAHIEPSAVVIAPAAEIVQRDTKEDTEVV